MDDPEVKDSPAAAFPQIFRDQVFHFSRLKGMKVQDAVDGNFDGVRILRFHLEPEGEAENEIAAPQVDRRLLFFGGGPDQVDG